jgi:molybdate transport system substrate-binding protein
MAASLKMGRRTLPLLALAAAVRPAAAATIDLSLACDTTLAPALRKVAAAYAAKTGPRVFVFPTGPGLLIPQLARNIQNDILVTQLSILGQAAQGGIIAAMPGAPHWTNPLVIAGRSGASLNGVFAACDPTAASDFDGPALLAKLSMKPAQVIGAVDTDEVAGLLLRSEAQVGFLHMTDVRAHPELTVIQTVSADAQAPFVYAAAVTKLASRPDPQGFVAFMQTPDAMTLLQAAGLEVQS